jgi:hypothetical protein
VSWVNCLLPASKQPLDAAAAGVRAKREKSGNVAGDVKPLGREQPSFVVEQSCAANPPSMPAHATRVSWWASSYIDLPLTYPNLIIELTTFLANGWLD